MTRDEMIKRLEAVALWVSEMADGLPPHSAAESMATGIESDVDAVLAALRSRPAPPDDLALRHAWEAGFRLCRSYGDNHHHFDGEQKERRWLDYIKGLAAPAPVAAPAHVSVSQGAALAAALDALESDATTEQRREAWDRLRDEFYPVAAPAPETPDVVDGQCPRCGERDGAHGEWCRR